MNTEPDLLLFLGKIQAWIEDLGQLAHLSNNPLRPLIAEFEQYFNKYLHEILSKNKTKYIYNNREITWNTLPR